MRHHNLVLAPMIVALLSGCVDAGDPPSLQGDPGEDTLPGEDLVSSDAVTDSSGTDSHSDGTSVGDADDVSVEDAGPDLEPSDGSSLDGPKDTTSEVHEDGQDSDSGAAECVEAGDCVGALEPCQVFLCEASLCVLSHVLPKDEVPCDDGVACTINDLCDLDGECLGEPDHTECDDQNVCTTNTCEATVEGGCLYIPLSDGDLCTDPAVCIVDGECIEGTCDWPDEPCDDGEACTEDSCDGAGSCHHTSVSIGTSCDAGNKCTTGDTCDGAGSCLPGETTVPEDCKDDEPCTIDGCDPSALGGEGDCSQTILENGAGCDDGDLCTNVDVCTGGECHGFLAPDDTVDQSEAPFCDDDNACTLSSCDPTEGCQHEDVELGSPCSDGDACTAIDSCKSGVCVPGDPLDCDDSTQCLDSSCDSGIGCVSEEIDQGTECDLEAVDGVCALAQCDGSGACGVFLESSSLEGSEGHYTASEPLSDGGWVLVGSVASDVPQQGTTCALVTRLGYDTEVLWQITPTCDGSPSPTGSAAYGVDVFPDGSFAVVGVEHTGPELTEVEPRLWVIDEGGSQVSSHPIGQGQVMGPAWDVRVLDDATVIVLLDEPLAGGEASRAVVREYQTSDDWAPDSVASDWLFQQTENAAVAQSIEAHKLFDVLPDEGTFGLIGSFVLSGDSIKQLIANFSLSTLPATVPAQVTYSELGDQGQVPLQASDGVYWASAPGAPAFVAAGSAIYSDVTWSQTNILNANGKLIGAYQIKDEHNQTVTRWGDDRLMVVAEHESAGARVHLLDLAGVTAEIVESDGGLVLLDTLELGSATTAVSIACHAGKACLVAGSSDGAPAWFVFQRTANDLLEPCGP